MLFDVTAESLYTIAEVSEKYGVSLSTVKSHHLSSEWNINGT
jgi:uncharacterized protein YjcR